MVNKALGPDIVNLDTKMLVTEMFVTKMLVTKMFVTKLLVTKMFVTKLLVTKMLVTKMLVTKNPPSFTSVKTFISNSHLIIRSCCESFNGGSFNITLTVPLNLILRLQSL